jgi:menaquinone-dependent protoporphyrinogen IX oxidase
MEWYNSPNAVTYQRYTYFDALCRHVLWLEIKRTSVPKRESSSEWQPIENFDESQERKHW